METVSLVDYAPHMLETKRLLHNMHELLIERKYEEAKELSFSLLVEVKLLSNAVNHHAEVGL